ncbi:MAG: SCO family protein [Steroidobacteraceae bacterium]|nr:SCO family protein [Steroidobacteraceae bacterium]MCW5572889.1 SCO family protein [Steroidobacteraceae bacterium]
MRKMGIPALALATLALLAGTAPAADLPPDSIYQLDAALTSESGKAIGLDVHRGHPVMITMFYASCPAACPLLIDTIRAVERSLGKEQLARTRVLMISIDPQRDTPAALLALAKSRRIDLTRWTLATADEATVRRIAALLSIQYRRLPGGEFNHSSIITVLSSDGEIRRQSSLLGRVDPEIVAAIE